MMSKQFKRLSALFIFISMAALLLFFGTPTSQRIHQNRLNRNLLRAVEDNDVLGAAALLKQGANVNTKDYNPITDALFRMRNGGTVEGGYTALMLACANKNVPLVQLLLQHGADVNKIDETGTTALMWSVMVHNARIVALLLEKGAQINIADPEGCTALMAATRRNDPIIVKLLLQHGADVNVCDKQSHTVLAWSIHKQFPRVIALLKQAGAKE